MTTLLIKAAEITKSTPMGGNVDVDKYIYLIKDVQVTVIEPLLGTKLYNKLQVDYAADTLTGDYLALVEDYIKPILIHSSFAEYVVIAAYNVSNGGINKSQPENTTAVSKSEVDYLSEKQRSKAQVYIERCERFLCTETFPEYGTQDNDYDIRSQDVNYMGGWSLGGDKKKEYLDYKNLKL